MEADQTRYLLHKLNRVFKDGYRPARGNQPYDQFLKSGVMAEDMVNCLGHIFNLRNQQFDDYFIAPADEYWHESYFTGFMRQANNDCRKVAELVVDFIRETGLKVAECDPAEPVTDFKSWKIAMYFSEVDMHYLLEDVPQKWSGKLGFSDQVERLRGVTPPARYAVKDGFWIPAYDLYNTYKITNPHADESNRYVQERCR